MRLPSILGTLPAVVFGLGLYAAAQTPPPVAPVRPVTTDYYGTKIVDPYRYMENLKDPQVQAWMKAQNAYTRGALASIPGRARLLARIRHFDQSAPIVIARRLPGDMYIIEKRPPQGNMDNLYLQHGLTGEDRLIVNPGSVKLAAAQNQKKGANAILGYSVSPDNRYIAVGIAPGGSERDTEIHVFETGTGRQLSDAIQRAWGSAKPSWLPGSQSFTYRRLQTLPPGAPRVEVEQKVRTYLHVLGRDPAADPAVFGYGVVPSIQVGAQDDANVTTSPGSGYVVGAIQNGVALNGAFYIEPLSDLGKTNTAWRRVADLSDDVSDVEIHGDDLYLLTYKNTPRYKVLRTSARHPDFATAETVVAPSQAVVTGIYPAADALYVQLLDGGISRLLRVPYGGNPEAQEVRLPFQGAIIRTWTDPRLPGALLLMTSWTKAPAIYAYDPRTGIVTNTKLQPASPYGAPTNLEAVEVKVRSYDGTLVPLSIVSTKGMKRDGSHPTWLNGYGAYGVTDPPVFLPMLLAWYEQGGIFADCHVRGGGDYGEAWHLAGKGATKPNTWRDFNACAEYLIRNHYTSPARLGGEGASAGGILIGRAITSRPDLFAAAIDWAGVSDTLRMETTPNGVPNIPEFGSVKTKAGFDALYAMSAYAHVRNGTRYPAVLVMTGANDPRVDPWQSDKMAARLQAATSSGKPVLLRVNYAGGHGNIGGTEAETQRSLADIWSFLFWQFGMPGFQPSAAVGQAPTPVAPVRPVADTYFGTKIVDPYQYMESLNDPAVQAWMRAQNAYARGVLDSIPGRTRVLAEIQQYQRAQSAVSAQRLPGGLYVIQKRGRLYLRHGVNGADRLLVDPAAIQLRPADRGLGATVLEEDAVSTDGRYLAVRIIPGGAERQSEIHVFDIASGRDIGEVLSGAFPRWVPGTHTLLYGRSFFEREWRFGTYLHILGTSPAADRAVFGFGVVPQIPTPPHTEGIAIAPLRSAYAIGWMRPDVGSPGSAFYIEPVGALGKTNSAWRKVAGFPDDVSSVAVHGNDLYLLSYKHALNFKLLRTSTREPDLAAAEPVIPESRAVITGIAAAQDALYVTLLDGGFSRLQRVSYGPNPRITEVALPFQGLLENLDVDPRIPGAQFDLTSWTNALTNYTYDPATNAVTRTGLEPAGPYDHPANLESEEVMVRSYDGTMVPLSIVHGKGMRRDGSNPALLFGYGAYGLVHSPIFAPDLLAWYQEGGMFAVCHVRGGGEFGEAWHLAGKEATKPNTWKDFIACAQYLVDHRYTSPRRLGGWGASAGGILIGRAIEARPDLFAAAIDENGMSDAVRGETTANGIANIPEFGDVGTPAGFRALEAMSPYAHVKAGVHYPAVLLTTGIHDPRVAPWEAAKMTARLQAASASGKPVLLTVDFRGGHGMIGRTALQTREFDADWASFLLWQFGMPGFQPPARH